MANRVISFVIRLKNAAGEGIKTVINACQDGAKAVDDAFSSVWGKATAAANRFVEAVGARLNRLSSSVEAFKNKLSATFIEPIQRAVKPYFDAVNRRFQVLVQRLAPVGRALASLWTKAANGARSFFSGISSRMKGFTSNLANIKAGFDMLAAGFRTVGGVIRTAIGAIQKSITAAFDRETLETRFDVLLGSAEKAAEHVKMLAEVGRTTPFSTEEIANASQSLIAYTQAALGGEKSILLIGDAAAATGGNIEELAMWTGRLYAAMQGGQPLGEMLARLVELKVITPQLRNELEEMAASGESFDNLWNIYAGHLAEFSGGMEKLSRTGNGLLSTLQDNIQEAFVTFGRSLMDVSKNGIETLINAIDRLTSSGELEKWAGEVKAILEPLQGIMANVLAGGETRKLQIQALGNQFKGYADYLFERLKLAFDYGADVLGAKLRPFKGDEWREERLGEASRNYQEGVARSLERLHAVYEANSTAAVAARGARLDDPTGEKARAAQEERLAAQRAAEERKAEAEAARVRRSELLAAAEEKKAAEARAQAEKQAAQAAAKEEEKNLRAQIFETDAERQRNADAISDRQAWVEQSRRQQAGLEASLEAQRKAWAGRSISDVDEAEREERRQKEQAREAQRFDRRVEAAQRRLEQVGGDESKLSRRDRLILGMDRKRREDMKRTEKEIEQQKKDRQEALNHMIRLDAAVQTSVRQRDRLVKLLEENLQFQGGN